MSEFKYEIWCKIDMTMFPSIAEVTDSLNKFMGEFGFEEKVGISSSCSIGTIISARELNNIQQQMILSIIKEHFANDPILNKIKVESLKQI